MKLKYKDIAPTRAELLIKQRGVCVLCNDYITDDAVLDHCHKTGLIRGVLHRGCNALLGKIENNMARNRMTLDRLEHWAVNLVGYINSQHSDLIHPKHKEPNMGRGRGKGKRPPKR
jgi:hypothetical protein